VFSGWVLGLGDFPEIVAKLDAYVTKQGWDVSSSPIP